MSRVAVFTVRPAAEQSDNENHLTTPLTEGIEVHLDVRLGIRKHPDTAAELHIGSNINIGSNTGGDIAVDVAVGNSSSRLSGGSKGRGEEGGRGGGSEGEEAEAHSGCLEKSVGVLKSGRCELESGLSRASR